MSAVSPRDIDDIIGELRTRIRQDTLTVLDGQIAWHQDLRKQLGSPRPVAAIMMDINNFKRFNTMGGQAYGDQVIQTVGSHIWNLCQATGAKGYRVGGDEFLVVVSRDAEASYRLLVDPNKGGVDAKNSSLVVQFLTASLQKLGSGELPLSLNKKSERASLSLGIAYVDTQDGTLGDVAKRASIALKHAKTVGKREFCAVVYESTLASSSVESVEFRQTCKSCGTLVQLVVPRQHLSNLPQAPLCPVCNAMLGELGHSSALA